MSDTATAVGSDHGAPEAAEAEKKKRKTEECVDAPASEGDAASKPTPDDVAVGQSTSEPVFGVFLFFFLFPFLSSCTGGGMYGLSMPPPSTSAPTALSTLPEPPGGFELAAGGGVAKNHLYVVEGDEPLVLGDIRHTFYTGYQGHLPSACFTVPFLPSGVCIRDPRGEAPSSFHAAGFIQTGNHSIFIIGADRNGEYVHLPLPSSNSAWCQSPTVDSPPKTGKDLQELQRCALAAYSSRHSDKEWKLESDWRKDSEKQTLEQHTAPRRNSTIVHTHEEFVNLQDQLAAHKETADAAAKEIADLKARLKAKAPVPITLDDKNGVALVDQIVKRVLGPLQTGIEEIVPIM